MKWSWLVMSAAALLVMHANALDIDKIKDPHSPADILGAIFGEEMDRHDKTGEMTPLYSSLVKLFELPKEMTSLGAPDIPVPKNFLMCTLCNTVFRSYVNDIRNGATRDDIAGRALNLCTTMNIQPFRVCNGLIQQNIDTFMYIILQRPDLSSDQMCGVIFQSLECSIQDMTPFEYSININPNQPPLSGSKDTSIPPGPNDYVIAHITDPHYDPNYQIGTWAACDEPCCCRFDQPLPAGAPASDAAQRWGDYRDCDSPAEVVVDAFQQVRRQHQRLDYIYFTGDIVDHGIWEKSRESVQQSIIQLNNMLQQNFQGVQIFPVIGNHEGYPVNVFAPGSVPPQYSTQWLYTFMANQWSRWLPESALATVRQGGYYTIAVRPGLRIIAMNNNDCYTFNWWLIYKPSYPSTQLQWVHDTLLASEQIGEKVHILYHHSPGNGHCHNVYAREYRRIVERFWNTISGQFCGHTHSDELNLFYSRNNPTQALNVLWNGGSTTAFSHVNPNYNMYTMDPTTFQVNSHETWIYNLTAANLTPNQAPRWFLEYNFQQEFGVPNLSPASLSNLAMQFANNPSRLLRYWQLKQSLADTALEAGCDLNCLADHLCLMVTSEFGNSPRCTELRGILLRR